MQSSILFRPLQLTVRGLPIIVYPHRKALSGSFRREAIGCLEEYVVALYDRSPELLESSQYHIVVLWGESGDRMADVWKFDRIAEWGSGPWADALVYREFERVYDMGVSAGDALILLGREEEWRRRVGDLTAYLAGPRPDLPPDIAATDEFYRPLADVSTAVSGQRYETSGTSSPVSRSSGRSRR